MRSAKERWEEIDKIMDRESCYANVDLTFQILFSSILFLFGLFMILDSVLEVEYVRRLGVVLGSLSATSGFLFFCGSFEKYCTLRNLRKKVRNGEATFRDLKAAEDDYSQIF